MARPLRLEYAGTLYHITSRGNRREDIYEDDNDRKGFLKVLDNVCDHYNWVCHAYRLMSNHYHLLIETPDSNLTNGMRQLNDVYTQTYRSARDWPWSSYRSTAGQSKAIKCLNTEWILATFGKRKSKAIERYKKFISVGKGQPSPWELLQNQVYLGGEQFIEKMQSYIDGSKELSEVPSSQRRPKPEELHYYEATNPDRNSAIVSAYKSGGYTLKEIGQYFAVHYSTVSGIIKNHKSKT